MIEKLPLSGESRRFNVTLFEDDRSNLRQRTTRIIGYCLVLSLAIIPPALAVDNIRVSYATLSAAYMDHICAMEKGYLREERVSVEVIRAAGGVATPGLLSGQFQFSSSQARL